METADCLCSHGGLDPHVPLLQNQKGSAFLWGTGAFPEDLCGGSPVVYGHWNNAVLDERGWPQPCVIAMEAPEPIPADGAQDRRFMMLALHVARRIHGQTAPNPAVGAVVADQERQGEIVARGWTQTSGRPHAEAHALAIAGDRARGKTMYVTLEPCSYHGRAYR